MKTPFILVVGSLIVLAIGASLVWLHHEHRASMGAMGSRLDALSKEVSELRIELAAQKPGAINPAMREAIVRVITEDRAEQKQLAEKSQLERYSQMWVGAVDRVVQKHGLTGDQRKGLVDLIGPSREKLSALDAQFSDLALKSDVNAFGKAVGQASKDFDAWQLSELTKVLGEEVAPRVDHEGFDFQACVGRWEASKQAR